MKNISLTESEIKKTIEQVIQESDEKRLSKLKLDILKTLPHKGTEKKTVDEIIQDIERVIKKYKQ